MNRYLQISLTVIFLNLGNLSWGAPPSLKVDQVVITGVHAFSVSTIESAVDISPGQVLDRHGVLVSEENIQSFYRSHGYDEMTVRTRISRKMQEQSDGERRLQNVLEFTVSEGRPIRVAEIQVTPLIQDQNFSKDSWKAQEYRLKKSINFLPGEILDQAKIGDAKRTIQENLLADEYVGAGVSQVDFEATSPGEEKGDSSRWVKVRFRVDMGDRVSFGFRGNSFLTWNNLRAIVDDLRSVGLGKDYLQVIRKRIEDEYRSSGFAKVSVTSYSYEEAKSRSRKVIYSINEGPRVRIEALDFDGNLSFSSEKLRSKFYSKASGVVQNGIYVEKDVQKSAELLTEWMKEKGFLSSKLVTINTIFPAKSKTQVGNSTAQLVIYLYEGNQTILRKVDFTGLVQMKGDEVRTDLGVKEGEALNVFALAEGIEGLKRRYRDLGFLDFQIKNEGKEGLVRYTQENRQADVVLDVSEGPQYHVSRIQVEGLRKTHSNIVLRELSFRAGDVLGESALTSSERKLRKLGLFSSVVVKPVDDASEENKKLVIVKLVESDRGTLVGGPGIRNDLGLRLYGQLTYANLWGDNHTASVSASVNRRFVLYNFLEGQAQVSYAWPWFLLPGLTFRPSFSVGRTQYLDFTSNQISASFAADNQTVSLSWDKQLLNQPNLLASFTYTFEGIHQFMATRTEDNSDLTIGTMTPRLTLDLRDNSLLPTSGFYTTSWLDLSPPGLGSNSADGPIGYYRLQFRADYHVPLPMRIGLYFSFRTGYEQSIVTTNNPNLNTIPLIKQFSLGGIGSLRGYNERVLNTATSKVLQGRPSDVIQGSLSYVNYRAQVDLPLTSSLKFDVFLDSANLLINDYGFKYMLYGTGCGFRYLTPVGSVNVDWGYKLNPPSWSQDRSVLHFSVGVI